MTARSHKPTRKGTLPARAGSKADFTEDGPTNVYDPKKHKAPQADAPQQVATPRPPVVAEPKPQESQKLVAISMKTPADSLESQSFVAVSMKTPGDPLPPKMPQRELPHVKLRAMSEMSRAAQPLNLGNIAPPYDPQEARKRNMKEYVLWGCIAVILASAIALVVWFVAT